MKSIIILLTLITNLAFAQEQEIRKTGSYNGISVATGIVAEYIKSDRQEVVVQVEKKSDLQYIKTTVEDGTLKIHIENSRGLKTIRNVKVAIYGNQGLNTITISSSAVLNIHPVVVSNDLKIHVSSSGQLNMNVKAKNITASISSSAKYQGKVESNILVLKATSSAKAVLTGTASTGTIQTSSSASADLSGLKTTTATVNASSSAKSLIWVTEELEANASSSARISYKGSPAKRNFNTSSSGKVAAL